MGILFPFIFKIHMRKKEKMKIQYHVINHIRLFTHAATANFAIGFTIVFVSGLEKVP